MTRDLLGKTTAIDFRVCSVLGRRDGVDHSLATSMHSIARCGDVGDCYVMRFVCHLGVFKDGTTHSGVVGDREKFNNPNFNPNPKERNQHPFWVGLCLGLFPVCVIVN